MSEMYIGRTLKNGKPTSEKYLLNSLDLTTHLFICGSTGSGKTVLGKALIEEAVKCGVPAVIIDLKGDLSSLKIPLFDVTESEISGFVDGYSEADQRERARKQAADFREMLSKSSVSISDVHEFRNRANIRIFTPKSRLYDQFSISFLTSPPDNFDEMMRQEPETVLNHISNQASNILKRLFGEDAVLTMHEEKNLMEAVILHLYRCGADLDGKAGIVNLIKTIYEVPFDRIGMLKVKEFISDERKMSLIRRLNTLLIGAESLWYEVKSIDRIINTLVKQPGDTESADKTNLYIFNLSFLENFDDRNLILSNIAMTLFNYMKRLGDSREPRAVFYIDEIGGGKLSFFPDDPIQNESKSAINLLLRQGRAFGLSCILSTQNPGDIDYRGLTNCHTWYVGKLLTKEDREKVMQGISATPYFLESYEGFVKSAGGGDFIVKSKDGGVSTFRERWLKTFHKVLTYDDIVKLKKALYYSDDLLLGANCLARKEFDEAVPYFERVLQKSPETAKAFGFLGEAHFGRGAYKEALVNFERALKYKDNEYPAARSNYYLGEIAYRSQASDRALEFYQRSVKADPEFADSYIRLAEIYLPIFKNQEALQNIQKYIVLKPGCDRGYYLMAFAQTGLSDYLAAENSVKKAVTLAKENGARYQYRYLEAKIKYLTGQYAHSLEIIESAMKLAGENGIDYADCESLSAQILVKFKEHARAVSCLESVITKRPADENAVTQLAELYYSTQQPEKTLETLERLSKINPRNPNIFNYRARLLMDAGKIDEAQKTVAAAPQSGEGMDKIETLRGLIHQARGNGEDALKSYIKAVELNPHSEEALYLISRYYENSRDYENQKNTLLKLIEFAPEEKYYHDLGYCYEKLNQYPKAIESFNKLYLMTMQNPEINLKKADWYRKSGNIQKAYECVEIFIKERPGSPDGYLVKGEIYTCERKYDEALDLYDRAEKFSRGDARGVWLSRCFTYKEMGEFEKAQFCEEKARGVE